MAMLIVATSVFLYYTTWTLLMVRLRTSSDDLQRNELRAYSLSLTPAILFMISSLRESGQFAYQ